MEETKKNLEINDILEQLGIDLNQFKEWNNREIDNDNG